MVAAKHRIAGFDGIRGIAALMVFASHRLAIGNAPFLGGFGLRLFFVLSGFLIVGSLHKDQVRIANGDRSAFEAWKTFTLRRAARIFPLYYAFLGALVVASLFISLPQVSGRQPLIYGLFLTNLYVEWTRSWREPVTHVWSLAIEEQFYLIAAPLILALPPKRTVMACLVVTASSFVWALWLAYCGEVDRAYVGSFTNFGLIAMGGVAALRSTRSSKPLSKVLQPLLLAGLLLIPFLGGQVSANPVIRQLAYPLMAAMLLAEMADHPQSRAVRLLEWRPLAALGVVSYGFYLLHPLIGPALLRALSLGVIDISPWSRLRQAPVLLVASVLAASASWAFLEKPILMWARRRRNPPRAGLASPVTI